mgnify:CR=1 FL=1
MNMCKISPKSAYRDTLIGRFGTSEVRLSRFAYAQANLAKISEPEFNNNTHLRDFRFVYKRTSQEQIRFACAIFAYTNDFPYLRFAPLPICNMGRASLDGRG